MCGRYALTVDPALLAQEIDAADEVARYAGLPGADPIVPNYNVAPTDPVLTVVARPGEPGDLPARRIRAMRWGLVPAWTKPRADGRPLIKGAPLINARAESLATTPTFRAAAQTKRCLVPMDGWYEWRTGADGFQTRKAVKTPFYLSADDGQPLFAAGLWSVWRPERQATPLFSCTIVTTAAAGALAEIHDRMPVVLGRESWDRWLDPGAGFDPAALDGPGAAQLVHARQVSWLVNNVANDGPELIAPAAAEDVVGEQITLL